MRRVLLFVGVVAVLGAVWFMLRSESEPSELTESPRASLPVPEERIGPQVEAPTTQRSSAVDPTAEVMGPPASYLAALGSIVGRVLDDKGVPMPDFPVDLVGAQVGTLIPTQQDWLEKEDFDFGVETQSGKTDAAGRFRFERVHPDSYFAFHLGSGTPRVKWDLCPGAPGPGQTLDVGDVKLDAYAIVIGRVVGEKGEPIAGATVRASRLPFDFYKFGLERVVPGAAVTFQMPGTTVWETFTLPPVVFRVFRLIHELEGPATLSAEDGSYRIEGAPLGDITVIAQKANFVLGYRGPIKTADGGEKRVGDVELIVGQPIDGKVVDGSDQGVASATVLAGPLFPFFPVALIGPLDPTNAEGGFHGSGFREGSHVVAAKRREACDFKVAGDVEPGVDEPVIRVDDTTTMQVRVFDPEQKVLADATIFVQPQNELSEVVLLAPPLQIRGRTRALEDGAIEVTGLSRRKFNVFGKRDGFSIGKTEIDLSNGPATCELRLEAERVATVRVVTAATGEPVEHAMVLVLDRIDESDAPGSMLPVAPVAMQRTDENGIAVLKGLKEGEQGVRVVHPAYAQGDATIVAPGPPLLVELRGGGSIRGKVVKNGAPIGETYVVVAVDVEHFLDVLPRATVASAADGSFSLPRLTPGKYLLKADKSFEAMAAEMQGPSLGNPASLGLGDTLAGIFGGASTVRTSKTDEVESIEELQPEQPESTEQKSDSPRVEAKVSLGEPKSDGSESGYTAIVKEGQETWLEIDVARLPGDFDKARLAGTVSVNGVAMDGLQVGIESSNGGPSRVGTTDSGGRFDLGEVAAGRSILRVAKKRGEALSYLATSTLDLAPNEVRSVDLRVEAGYVEGRVRSTRDSAPIEGVRVRLVPLDAKDEMNFEGCFQLESTGTDGRFRFDVVPEGKYKVEFQRERFAAAKAGPFEVPKRGAPSTLDVKLVECVRVTGKIELPPGGPAGEAMLFVHFPSVADLDFSGFVFCEPKTKTFVLENVAPGDYDVNVYADGTEFEPVRVSVPNNGLENCVLRPQLKVELPPIPSVPGAKPPTGGG